MDNTPETSEASAETTDAENITSANLSIEDLAQSFVEKVEAEAEEPSPEATEESTDTEVADAEEDQEGEEVLLQSDEEESEEESEEPDESQPKGLQKALKQINRLTARAKSAEEEVTALKSQVQNLKSQPTEEAQSGKPELEKIQNMKDLESLRKEAMAAKKWALQNIGKDYVEADGREFDDATIRNILTEAEEYLTEKIPQRANFLQQRQNWVKDTIDTFPWSAKGDGPEWELFQQIRQGADYKELLDRMPNGDFVAATMVEGIQSIKARQDKAKASPKKKAKTPPPTDPADAVAPPAESKKVRQDKKRKAALGTGNISVDQFAQYLNS